jgi:DNA gyrase/topoisomerase IV subunit A
MNINCFLSFHFYRLEEEFAVVEKERDSYKKISLDKEKEYEKLKKELIALKQQYHNKDEKRNSTDESTSQNNGSPDAAIINKPYLQA